MALLKTRRAPLVAGLALGALSLVAYQRAGYSTWMLLIWLAGLAALGVYYRRESGALPRISRGDLLAGLALFVVFAPLYLARLYDWPVQISSDESTIMDVSADYSSAHDVDPFSVSFYANRQSMLFVVWGHLGKLLGGIDLEHMRLLHALVGLITIAASYFLFRQLLSRGWALFASGIFGLNHSFLMISRLAMRENTAVAAEVIALALLLRGFRHRHLFTTYLGGVVAGIGFFAYHPGRAAFFLWAVFLGLLALLYRPMFPVRRIATFGAAALVGLVIVAGPLVISEREAPTAPPQVDPAAQLLITKAGRQHQMEWVGASSIRDGILTNVRYGLKTFNDNITDHGYIYVNEGHGFVDPLTGILVWVGAGVLLLALIVQRRREEPWPLLMLSSFIVLWLGFAFIVNKAPNYTRLLIAVPFVAYLVTIAVRFLAQQAEGLFARSGRRLTPAPTVAVASAVLVAIAALNLSIAWDYIDTGRSQGNPIGSTARYIGDRPGRQFYLVGEENGPYPYFSWGNRNWWHDWLARVTPNTRLTETASNEIESLQPPPPFTMLMSRAALDTLGTGLAERYPTGRVRNVMPDGTLVAFEVDDERAASG